MLNYTGNVANAVYIHESTVLIKIQPINFNNMMQFIDNVPLFNGYDGK